MAADDDCGTIKKVTEITKNDTTATVTVNGVAVGDKVIVYYMKDLTDARKISVKGSSFPQGIHCLRRHCHEDRE